MMSDMGAVRDQGDPQSPIGALVGDALAVSREQFLRELEETITEPIADRSRAAPLLPLAIRQQLYRTTPNEPNLPRYGVTADEAARSLKAMARKYGSPARNVVVRDADGHQVWTGNVDEDIDVARLEQLADQIDDARGRLDEPTVERLLVEALEVTERIKRRTADRAAAIEAEAERRRLAKLPAPPTEWQLARAYAWLEVKAIDIAAGIDPDTTELLTADRFYELLGLADPPVPKVAPDPQATKRRLFQRRDEQAARTRAGRKVSR